MSMHPGHGLPEGLLYILVSENNDTGLSSERARQLGGAILQEMRTQIRKAWGQGLHGDWQNLCAALDAWHKMEDMPRQPWESSSGREAPKRSKSLPSPDALYGSDPDFTGGVESTEYLHQMRARRSGETP